MKRSSLQPLALAFFLGALACPAMAQPTPSRPASAPAKPASAAAPVVARPAEDPNAIRVLLAPALETTLVSQVAGRVSDVSVKLGDKFAKGKTLVRFDCSEQQARLQMSDAEAATAIENHETKLRLQGLQQAGEVEVSMAANNAAKARAQVNLYRAQMSQCSINAPFSGQVVKIAVKPFQAVNQAQILMEIISDGPLKLRLNAPAKWVSWLKPGTPFEVAIDETGKRYKAKVTALNGRIDAVSQTIELEASIADKAPDLLPGMSGVARFTPPAQ